MSDKDARQGWLRELKPGDEVAIPFYSLGWSARKNRIVRVSSVSPSGRITVETAPHQVSVYDSRGSLMKRDKWSSASWLAQVTPELRTSIARADAEDAAAEFLQQSPALRERLKTLTDEQLRSISVALAVLR